MGSGAGGLISIKIYSTHTLIASASVCSAYMSSQPPRIERMRSESENIVCVRVSVSVH